MTNSITMATLTYPFPGIGRIMLDRSDMRNALDAKMIEEVTGIFLGAAKDPNCHVIQLCGEGKVFCAGADINMMKQMADASFHENEIAAKQLSTLFETIECCPKPTVAIVQGGAYGGGVGLMAACDIAVAAEDATFCLSEVRLGIIPAVISPYLINAMGLRQTQRLTLTGEKFFAQEALRLGLVHQVVSIDQLESAAQKICENLLKGSPQAQCAVKDLFRALETPLSMDNRRSLTAKAIAEARASHDGKEGLDAFLNKRRPEWK